MKNIIMLITLVAGILFAINGYGNDNSKDKKIDLVMIDLSPNKPVQRLFSMTILTINGESVAHRDDVLMLKPGQYHLKFSANIQMKYFSDSEKILRTKLSRRNWDDSLDLLVEAGNIYHLGFDASERDTKDWKPVLLSTSKIKK